MFKPSPSGNEDKVGHAKHVRISIKPKQLMQLEIEYPPFVTCENVEPRAGSSDLKRSVAKRDKREPSEHLLRQYGGEKGEDEKSEPKQH